jgi:hypothetical protein
MSTGILLTIDSAITQLAIVNEGMSKAKREELENLNGYYINPALVGIAYHQICFATLRVIIGIQNSLLECDYDTTRLQFYLNCPF